MRGKKRKEKKNFKQQLTLEALGKFLEENAEKNIFIN